MKQQQFLEVVDRDRAEKTWQASLRLGPLRSEYVSLDKALGRILAEDVRSNIDVPGFDRSNMDGFAVRAEDTFGATEEAPISLRINSETIPTGIVPDIAVNSCTATAIATGGMLPRGADAVVPVESTDLEGESSTVLIRKSVVPGSAISFAGTDMGTGETVLFAGTRLTSRETGVLAAIGHYRIAVVCRPQVAILSTGNEIVQPSENLPPGGIYDSNGQILADAVTELGAEPVFLGSFPDDEKVLRAAVRNALSQADVVLISGGTSKGEGDLNASVVADLKPGIVVHGVALKPGKPICLASDQGKPVALLPGFPTSAIFTFHEFVAPVIRRLLGQPGNKREAVSARLAIHIRSERGRLEYLLVRLTEGKKGSLACYPMGKGSGSVTSFSRADGFVRIDRNTEIVEEGTYVDVTLIGRDIAPSDLVIIGSHCVGLDVLASQLAREGLSIKLIAVGSETGLAAAKRGECDLAPIHLFDPKTCRYNEPYLSEGLELVKGYKRMQGVVTRPEETRSIDHLLEDTTLRMVNRNRGSGTRVLIDQLLEGRRPPGYAYEPRSHYAVAAAIAQQRADWGVAIESVASERGLRFLPIRAEHYDFALSSNRAERPSVRRFRELLGTNSSIRGELEKLGFSFS